jgi:hypothetical protein
VEALAKRVIRPVVVEFRPVALDERFTVRLLPETPRVYEPAGRHTVSMPP